MSSKATYSPLASEEGMETREHETNSLVYRFRHSSWTLVILNLAGLTINFFLVLCSVAPQNTCSGTCIPHTASPASASLEYQEVVFHGNLNDTSVYKGERRPELDAAWSELMEGINIRVSSHDLASIGRTSVKLADDSGDYFATLDALHQIHCLKEIRQHILRDSYYPDQLETLDTLPPHIDHCIDSLRQQVMCHADASLITYDWLPAVRKPWANFEVQHQCVNWEKFQLWAKDHSFSIHDKMLSHPKFGVPQGWRA